MGILNSIKEKLFGKPAAGASKPATAAPSPSVSSTPTSGMPASAIAAMEAGKKAAMASAAAVAAASAPQVDIEAVLDAAVSAKGIKLNWRTSIVDLMKAIDLDSSLAARKELAADLNYTGSDPDGSAEKNIWLHKALMKTLAENGGKIPNDLLS